MHDPSTQTRDGVRQSGSKAPALSQQEICGRLGVGALQEAGEGAQGAAAALLMEGGSEAPGWGTRSHLSNRSCCPTRPSLSPGSQSNVFY